MRSQKKECGMEDISQLVAKKSNMCFDDLEINTRKRFTMKPL